MKQSLYFLIILVLYAPLVFCQDTEASRAKQRQLMNDAGVMHIQLLVMGTKSTSPNSRDTAVEPFKEGDKIKVKVVITNSSNDPVRVPITDTYLQNRPQLYKDGDLLPYLKTIERVTQVDEAPTSFLRTDSGILSPSTPKLVEVISLSDWYKPLKPGHYRLTVKHRFEWGGTWIESSPGTFEVSSKQ